MNHRGTDQTKNQSTTNYAVADFVLGFMDGITVGPALVLGMYAGGATKQALILATISDMIAGSISMGLADGLSIDTISQRKDDAVASGIRTGTGYLLGSSVPLIVLLLVEDIKKASIIVIMSTIILLGIFGFIRGKAIHESITSSITKVMIIGISAMVITYVIQSVLKIH